MGLWETDRDDQNGDVKHGKRRTPIRADGGSFQDVYQVAPVKEPIEIETPMGIWFDTSRPLNPIMAQPCGDFSKVNTRADSAWSTFAILAALLRTGHGRSVQEVADVL
jgi:hypothetical protein